MRTKIVIVFICLLLISIIPNVLGSEITVDNTNDTVGFGVGRIIGIFPRVEGDNIRLIMIVPCLQNLAVFTCFYFSSLIPADSKHQFLAVFLAVSTSIQFPAFPMASCWGLHGFAAELS